MSTTLPEARPTAEFKAKLRFMLQLSSEAWMSAHKDEVRGRIHWHTMRRSEKMWQVRFHLLGSPSMACDLVLPWKIIDIEGVLAMVAKQTSGSFHGKLFRNRYGCLVCRPMETAEVFCAIRRDKAGLPIKEHEAAPYFYAAKFEKEKEGAVAVAERLARLLDELPPVKAVR